MSTRSSAMGPMVSSLPSKCRADVAANQAKRSVFLLRYAMKPTPRKPRSIIAQVEGSGTAPTFTWMSTEPSVWPSVSVVVRSIL